MSKKLIGIVGQVGFLHRKPISTILNGLVV
jgi:hypothetical protein